MPEASPPRQQQQETVLNRLRHGWRQAEEHVTYHGRYSAERFCAFAAYNETASFWRVAALCVCSFLPTLVLIVIIETLPLRDPNEGPIASQWFWVRIFLSASALTCGTLCQMRSIAPSVVLPIQKILYISIYTGAGYAGTMFLLALLWVFPIPFSMMVIMPIWQVLFVSGTLFVIGKNEIQTNETLQRQLIRYSRILLAQSMLLLLYPAYNAWFISLKGNSQLALLLILPILKTIIKKLITSATAGTLDDAVPVLVVGVDIFNALYQSKCMQNAGSLTTSIGIIIIDAFHNFYSLYNITKLANEIQDIHTTKATSPTVGLLSRACTICEHPHELDPSYLLSVPMRSHSIPVLPTEKRQILENMAQLQLQAKSTREITNHKTEVAHSNLVSRTHQEQGRSIIVQPGPFPKNAVVPFVLLPASTIVPADKDSKSRRPRSNGISRSVSQEKTLLLINTLALLQKCELVLLIEFIECAVPWLYSIYLPILYHLPSAEFYPEMKSLTLEQLYHIASTIFIYGGMEFVSLVVVHMALRRRFGFSGFRLLAFVLENECLIIQGNFLAWALVTLQFTLQHFGNVLIDARSDELHVYID